MTQLYDLSRICEEINGDICPFVELFKSAKAEKLDVQDVIKLLKVAKNSLPTVEYKI